MLMSKGHSKVIGIGGYVPEQTVSSKSLLEELKTESRFGIPVNWIDDVCGIVERRIAPDDAKPSDLALSAAQIALDDAGLASTDIDLIIYCGIDRDWVEPATAHNIQSTLGSNAVCIDVSNACHGFINGLSIADAYIATGAAENVLVVTGELPSRVLFKTLKILKSCRDIDTFKKMIGVLTVGDGGGALILTKKNCDDTGFHTFMLDSQGRHADLCYYKYDDNGKLHVQMIMDKISAAGLRMHERLIAQTYEHLGWIPQDVTRLVCHQVGKNPLQRMAKLASIPFNQTTISYKYYGNITSATIPFNLHLSKPSAHDKILILGAGSGLSISQVGLTF